MIYGERKTDQCTHTGSNSSIVCNFSLSRWSVMWCCWSWCFCCACFFFSVPFRLCAIFLHSTDFDHYFMLTFFTNCFVLSYLLIRSLFLVQHSISHVVFCYVFCFSLSLFLSLSFSLSFSPSLSLSRYFKYIFWWIVNIFMKSVCSKNVYRSKMERKIDLVCGANRQQEKRQYQQTPEGENLKYTYRWCLQQFLPNVI